MSDVKDLVEKLSLKTHPEGGFYNETYRSAESLPASALPERFTGERQFSTAIYYLLEAGHFSAFHRIRSDEVWHLYHGGPIEIFELDPEGTLHTHVLRGEPLGEACFQAVVPAGRWFAARPVAGAAYVLVGCTVSPGFDFADFEMADRAAMIAAFPQHEALITELTYDPGS